MDAEEKAREVGRRLRNQRLRASITLAEMAAKTGLTKEELQIYETTGKIPLNRFQKFWQILSTEPFPVWIDKLMK